MFKMSSISTNARIDTSDHGLSNPFKGVGAVANGLSSTQMCWPSVSTFSTGAEWTRAFVSQQTKIQRTEFG